MNSWSDVEGALDGVLFPKEKYDNIYYSPCDRAALEPDFWGGLTLTRYREDREDVVSHHLVYLSERKEWDPDTFEEWKRLNGDIIFVKLKKKRRGVRVHVSKSMGRAAGVYAIGNEV